MNKESKTASELEAIILQRAGELAGCAQVKKVAVTSGDTGWRVVTILRNGHVMRSFKEIDDIATELRLKYDLAASPSGNE
jgi:hypothetical protein